MIHPEARIYCWARINLLNARGDYSEARQIERAMSYLEALR